MRKIKEMLEHTKNLDDFIVELFSGVDSAMEIGSQDNNKAYQIWKELRKPKSSYHVAEHEFVYETKKAEIEEQFDGANIYGLRAKNLARFLNPKPELIFGINFLSYQDDADLDKGDFPLLKNLSEKSDAPIVFAETRIGPGSMAKSGSRVYQRLKGGNTHPVVDYLVKQEGFELKKINDTYVIYKE